jgi:hypothetical protein
MLLLGSKLKFFVIMLEDVKVLLKRGFQLVNFCYVVGMKKSRLKGKTCFIYSFLLATQNGILI